MEFLLALLSSSTAYLRSCETSSRGPAWETSREPGALTRIDFGCGGTRVGDGLERDSRVRLWHRPGPTWPRHICPELVAAVANAGGIGFLRAPDWESPYHLRDLIRKTRMLTDKPFGVGVVLAFPHKENIKVILDEKVAVLQVYCGEYPPKLVEEAHRAGVKVIHQVGSFVEAEKVKNAGVDAIIVQGHEAGRHVFGQDSLMPLLPRVVDLVSDLGISVIAAGGIVDGCGYAAALALGAHGEKEIRRFAGTVPNKTTTGDIESMVMYAGEGVGRIKEILLAGEVVKRLVGDAQRIIKERFSEDSCLR